MDKSNDGWDQAQVSALEYTWGQYRIWAATARAQRAHIFSWRTYTLLLTVAGAFLATLSQMTTGLEIGPEFPISISAAFGWLSGISIALATFFGREILRPEAQNRWVSSRSIAEALKSEAYRFRSGTTPYNGPDAPERLNENTRELLAKVTHVQAATLADEQKRERLPEGPLSVDAYIEKRVDEQIDNFYHPRVIRYKKVVKRGRTISLGLGAVAVVLALFGATGLTAGWIALITTITAALAAYLYSGRYQYLIMSYQATGRQLELLKNHWTIIAARPDTTGDKRSQFIMDCETVISIENSAWMSQLIDIN